MQPLELIELAALSLRCLYCVVAITVAVVGSSPCNQ